MVTTMLGLYIFYTNISIIIKTCQKNTAEALIRELRRFSALEKQKSAAIIRRFFAQYNLPSK
jgi:hypothetical protein